MQGRQPEMDLENVPALLYEIVPMNAYDHRMDRMRNYLYKLIIDDVTDICYRNSLDYFPSGSRILDVGIGNGIMS